MKIKKIIELFVPPIIHTIKRKFRRKKNAIIHPLPQISRKGDRIVIIGSGPSLNKTMEIYGEAVCNTESVMVNFSANTNMYERIKPSAYLMVDPIFFEETSSLKESLAVLLDTIVTKTTWPMRIILPFKAQGSVVANKFKENSNLEVLYFEDGWNQPKEISRFEAWDKNLMCPPGQTVLNTAVWMAIYWGYKEVYLIGADTSFLEDTHVDQENNHVYTVDSHFYKSEEACPKNPNLWQNKRRYIPAKYHEEIETIYIILKSYWDMREYADWKGVKVYNASEYSWIDAFERKKLK